MRAASPKPRYGAVPGLSEFTTQTLVPQPVFESSARNENVDTCDDAYTELVKRQSRLIFRVAYSVLRSSQDAEDVVQATFLKLYRSQAWKTMDNERAFLSRMVWRMAVDLLRTRRTSGIDVDLVDPTKNPEQTLIDADRNAVVWRLIEALPDELRQPLSLSTVDELSSQEIGKVMGIPEGTVRTRLMRAREILKQKLAALVGGP